MLAMLKTCTFSITQNVLRCLLLHLLRIVFASFALDHSPCARMIWILTTILILFVVFNDELMRSSLRVNNGSLRSVVIFFFFQNDVLVFTRETCLRRSLTANNGVSPFYHPSIHQISTLEKTNPF